jgi:hypothetical protein
LKATSKHPIQTSTLKTRAFEPGQGGGETLGPRKVSTKSEFVKMITQFPNLDTGKGERDTALFAVSHQEHVLFIAFTDSVEHGFAFHMPWR